MLASKNGIKFLTQEEGLKLKAYLCTAGVPTIGVGSTMYPTGSKVKLGDTITPERAMAILEWELKSKGAAVRAALVNTQVTQNQFDSLVSFTYNLGVGALQSSTLIKKVRNNPNDQTRVTLAAAHPTVQDYMKRKGLKEINTIHHEFMKWVFVENPKTKKKEISEAIQNRRNREYQLYSTK